jgi:hypothetical protein
MAGRAGSGVGKEPQNPRDGLAGAVSGCVTVPVLGGEQPDQGVHIPAVASADLDQVGTGQGEQQSAGRRGRLPDQSRRCLSGEVRARAGRQQPECAGLAGVQTAVGDLEGRANSQAVHLQHVQPITFFR